MTESTEKRRWNAYACPACRAVFKFPDDTDQQGLACPACHQVLQIPDRHSNIIPPIAEIAKQTTKPKKIRKRRRRNQAKDHLSWENESGQKLVRKGRRRRKPSIFMVTSTLILGGLLAWLFLTDDRISTSSDKLVVEPPPVVPSIPKKPILIPTDVEEVDTDFLERHKSFIKKAEELANKFLSAKSVDELRDIIRNPEITIPKIIKLHPDNKIDMGGLLSFNPTDQFRKSGDFISVTVRTKNYDERTMVFTETPDGIRIDWESWVGWCEMGWSEFMEAKPTTGILFRVKLNDTNYYNFDFSEESKWRSYTLLSHDEKSRMYGYVELGTQVAKDIGNAFEPGDRFFTLLLKFPENASSNNQVIIERVISSGWIIPNSPSP